MINKGSNYNININHPELSNNANNIAIDPKKCSNYVMLGWEGLSVTNRYRLRLTLSSDNLLLPGRITFTNSLYIDDNGVAYYNANNQRTIIIANLLFPDGTLRKNSVILLRNGWVELSKVRILTANNIEKIPTLSDLQNVYMVYSWGGNVSFKYGNATIPTINANSAIVSFAQNLEYALSRTIASDQNIVRVHTQNKSFYINTDGSEGTLYVIMPKAEALVDAFGQVDYPEPISWVFGIPSSHREVVFKTEAINSKVEDANVPNLENLSVVYGAGVTSLTINNTQNSGSTDVIYFKITYYPYMHLDVGHYIVERITPINSL